jgi:hypothetical protein
MPSDLTFALGTFSVAGGPPFGGLWVGERVVALRALATERAGDNLAVGLAGDTVETVLEHWQQNLPQLEAAAHTVRELGSERSVHVDTLHIHAPSRSRRQ